MCCLASGKRLRYDDVSVSGDRDQIAIDELLDGSLAVDVLRDRFPVDPRSVGYASRSRDRSKYCSIKGLRWRVEMRRSILPLIRGQAELAERLIERSHSRGVGSMIATGA